MDTLNRMVSAYLEIAEIQARNKIPMYMNDWIVKLDEFLRLTGKDILQNAGSVSHDQAIKKANTEYEKYKDKISNELSEVEKHFINQLEQETVKISKKS